MVRRTEARTRARDPAAASLCRGSGVTIDAHALNFHHDTYR
jgi:hypothetical protein